MLVPKIPIFRLYDIPTPLPSASFNNPLNISPVADGLQNLTLHPHPQRNEWVKGCLICRKSYKQIIEETVADYFNQTAQTSETVRDCQIKRIVFFDGIQSGVFSFSTRDCRKLPPVTASSTPLISMDKTRACRDTLCPYSKIELTKLSLNISLDRFPPPHFMKYDIYTSLSIFMHLCAKSIPIANKLVPLENGYSQLLTVLN